MKQKKISENVRVSFVLTRAQHNHIKQISISMSAQERRNITVSESIRMAIETLYPLPKQLDLFEKVPKKSV